MIWWVLESKHKLVSDMRSSIIRYAIVHSMNEGFHKKEFESLLKDNSRSCNAASERFEKGFWGVLWHLQDFPEIQNNVL